MSHEIAPPERGVLWVFGGRDALRTGANSLSTIIETAMLHHSISARSSADAAEAKRVFKNSKNGTQRCDILSICRTLSADTVSLNY